MPHSLTNTFVFTLAAVALLLTGVRIGAAQSHEQAWENGQRAFASGNYSTALEQFIIAEQNGLDGAAIHYNIAVCHFKLSQYDRAESRFNLIAREYPPMRALATYNLGLVARRRGDAESARRYFLSAYQSSGDDETLRILSSNMLKEAAPPSSVLSGWSGAAGARLGHDSNVALRDELGLPGGSSVDSAVLDVFASARLPVPLLDGLQMDADLYLAEYFDADDFDQLAADAGVVYNWQRHDWIFDFGAHAGFSTFGGDTFDRRAGLSVEARNVLQNGGTVEVGYRLDKIDDANAAFAGIKGTRQQLSLRYVQNFDAHRLALHARFERNDRDDPGVSPRRFRIGADYRYLVDARWSFEGGLSFRNSDYDDLQDARSEDLLVVRAGASYLLSSSWLATLDLRASDNDSGDERFAYDRTQVMLGVIRTF